MSSGMSRGGGLGVGVIGGGAWGLALAVTAARNGAPTLLLSRRARATGDPCIELARDAADLAKRARLIVLAVPSRVAREVARNLGSHVDGGHLIVHGIRGLVRVGDAFGSGPFRRPMAEELQTISDVVREETPVRRIGALGGPALASDLLTGRPSVMICGSHYPEVIIALRRVFGGPLVRLHVTEDLLGLEWASALVGCLAIGVGYARGVGLGPGLLAAFITRAVEEAGRLAAAAGGDGRTLLGLAGYGDLLATIAQAERPEVRVGEALAKGNTLEEAVGQAQQSVEAVELTEQVVAWAEARDVPAPVFATLARSVLTGRTSDALVHELMSG